MAYLSTKAKKRAFLALKLIGIVLFLWIISRIDREQAIGHITGANMPLFLVSFITVYAVYAAKTVRWHTLVLSTELRPTLYTSWRLYNIGVFLALITPGKLGELGRAGYLRQAGIHGATGICVALLDRAVDAAVIGIMATGAISILFGTQWALAYVVTILCSGACVMLLWRSTHVLRRKKRWLHFLTVITTPRTMLMLILSTTVSWLLYFAWGTLVARSIGITTPVTVLSAVFTVAGILALVPVAPSGLGTREAVLLFLLASYGVSSEQAVALGLLMFVSIVLSSLLGAWYWMTYQKVFFRQRVG